VTRYLELAGRALLVFTFAYLAGHALAVGWWPVAAGLLALAWLAWSKAKPAKSQNVAEKHQDCG
jgi:hypothetical protein